MPMILHCGHSFCKKCTVAGKVFVTVGRSKEICCLTCGEPAPGGDASSIAHIIRPNYALLQVLKSAVPQFAAEPRPNESSMGSHGANSTNVSFPHGARHEDPTASDKSLAPLPSFASYLTIPQSSLLLGAALHGESRRSEGVLRGALDGKEVSAHAKKRGHGASMPHRREGGQPPSPCAVHAASQPTAAPCGPVDACHSGSPPLFSCTLRRWL
jgi:hypothetical protein